MKFEIGTAKLNSILTRVNKGVGGSKVIPITNYIELILEDGDLFVTATDSVNFITYKEPNVDGDDGNAVVLADVITKLVAKTTKTKMSFELKDNYLEVTGNGTYKVEINTEDTFPSYDMEMENSSEVDTKTIKKVFKVNESAIAIDMTMPYLTGFNLGDMITTTDSIKMCINNVAVLPGKQVLLTQKMAELVDTITDDKIKVFIHENKIMFETTNITIFGVQLDGINDFPDIAPLAQLQPENLVKLGRLQLLEVLERMSIFVNKLDNNGVVLNFLEEGLQISDLKENSTETVAYKENKINSEAEIKVSIVYLQQLLSALSSDYIALSYQEGLPLKLHEEGVTQFLATIGEQEESDGDSIGNEEVLDSES